MNLTLKQKKLQELYPTKILFQTTYWGEVKTLLGWNTFAFEIDSSRDENDMLVIVKPVSEDAVAAYVPQGPEFAPDMENYGTYLEELSELLLKRIDSNLAFIRYDLPWESPYAQEMQKRSWFDYPESRVREMRMNFGTRHWNLKKAPVDLTVADSCIVDIGCNETEVLSRMKPKTRYNINLAHRKGVRVSIVSDDNLPTFYKLYCETAQRNGFCMGEYRYFSALFSAYKNDRSSSEIILLLATHNQDVLAGAIIAISETGAIFLHGASSNNKRNYMGPYALHWEAIRYARSRQCRTYDMGAVAPGKDPNHSFFGLFRFKTGFGGRIVHNSGSWDYPVKDGFYVAYRNRETVTDIKKNSGYFD